MWPLKRAPIEECLRIGRHAVQRWQTVDGALSLLSEHALTQDAAPQSKRLAEAIGTLYPASPGKPITVLLESAWLPVAIVDTGPNLLRATQVEALARHRFGLHYADSNDPVAAWELRIEHRAGSRHALAYGLSPSVKQTLVDAARTLGLEWAVMTPAMAWGLERLHPTGAWSRSAGWFLWPEQDRTLVARIASNELGGLNPGAQRADDEPGLLRLVDAESVRLGVVSIADPIVAATWGSVPRAARIGGRVTWLDVRGQAGPGATPRRSTVAEKAPA